MTTDWGVEYVHTDGSRTVSPFGSEPAARAFVADHNTRDWKPRPVRVMTRECTPWVAADELSEETA